jgi:RHS repeat-associated protein
MPRFVAHLVLVLTLVVGTLGTASAQTVTYFHNDIAGTPMLATDAAGAVVWKENYLPYGYRQVADPASGGNRLWFTGKAYDPETQLSYMGARYYMPLLGRFTGIDPVEFVPEQPHSFNRYAYANNNPYKYVDPDGKIAETVWDAFNIALGFQSLVNNLRVGNWSGAAVDGVGLGADGIAAAIPMVPGGAGAVIAAHRVATAAKGEAAFFRGVKEGEAPSFVPRPKDFKVDPKTGFVKDTHGVSVFDNPASVSSKGYVPHRVDQSSVPDSLRFIQRGSDPRHFEIVPMPGANLTPQQFINACSSIVCVR